MNPLLLATRSFPLPAPLRRPLFGVLMGVLLSCVLTLPAWAEKADRYKPLNLAADHQGTLDMVHKTAVFSGNVVITKGTLVIEADRVEIRELPNGTRQAVAYGSKTRQATFRQKRDKPDESVFGQADRLEYDEKSDTVRFVSRAIAQRLIANKVADEISGDWLVYDNQAELFSASSSPDAATGQTTGGRVRVILAPREAPPAEPDPGASTPAATPGDKP